MTGLAFAAIGLVLWAVALGGLWWLARPGTAERWNEWK